MASVPDRLYAARSPQGVEIWIPEDEMPAATSAGLPLVKTVTLTDAQIKALPTAPIEIVPAPGAGKSAILQSAFLYFRKVAEYVGNVDQCTLSLGYTGLSGGLSDYLFRDDSQSINSILDFFRHDVASSWGYQLLPWFPGMASNASEFGRILPSLNWDPYENVGISLWAENFAGDLTGGDPANLLQVTVTYIVVDV